MKRYFILCFVIIRLSLFLRPIQSEIYDEEMSRMVLHLSCDQYLHEGEKQLKTIKEVMEYNPIAVFAPGIRYMISFPVLKSKFFMGSR